MKRIQNILLVLTLTAFTSSAAEYMVKGDKADNFMGLNVSGDPVLINTSQELMVSGADNAQYNQKNAVSIFVFELPDLGEEVIEKANLTIDLRIQWPGASSFPLGLDVYGVRTSSDPTVLVSDYGFGTNPGNGKLIQDNVASVANKDDLTYEKFTSVETSIDASTALVAWLTEQYSSASPGDYVFFRYNSDGETSNNSWKLVAADSKTEAVPVLKITTVYGPGTLGLLVE